MLRYRKNPLLDGFVVYFYIAVAPAQVFILCETATDELGNFFILILLSIIGVGHFNLVFQVFFDILFEVDLGWFFMHGF